jgi:hypothetical protein
MIEMLNGYSNTEYEMYLLGNLNEAQEQITDLNIYISNEIRDLRVDIFDKIFTLDIHHLAACKAIYEKIKNIDNRSIQIEMPDKKISTIKPCGGCAQRKVQ